MVYSTTYTFDTYFKQKMNTLEKRTENFLENAKQIHGDKYEYSKVKFVNHQTKVSITCKLHGTFEVTPGNHLTSKRGCPTCAGNIKSSTEIFINRSKLIHGDTYEYTKVNYTNTNTKVLIICKFHGEFEQSPKKHLSGQGCSKCGREKTISARKTNLDEFIKVSKDIHNDKYDYSKVEFNTLTDKVTIGCKVHGDFLQQALVHKNGSGCTLCWGTRRLTTLRLLTTEDIIRRSKNIHGDKYDYSDTIYSGPKNSLKILCPKHGYFSQAYYEHSVVGSGCKACSHIGSNAQRNLGDLISNLGVSVTTDYKLSTGKEIDIFCKDLNIGFEYNGLRFHGEHFKDKMYHLNKTKECEENGIRLIHIWEDEWLHSKSKVENLVNTILGLIKSSTGARKCKVEKIQWDIAKAFLDEIHLQGSCAPTKYCYGLIFEDSLVGVMCFTTSTISDNKSEIELIRFCSKNTIPGGFSKLLKFFLRENPNFKKIISFSDKRWSQGNVYKNNGFILEGSTTPSYWWGKGDRRFHRRGFQHQYLATFLPQYDPNLTEVENCHNNGYFRIWDCGKDKWILHVI